MYCRITEELPSIQFYFFIFASVYQFSLWLTLEKSALETLCGGQLTFSTQLVKPIYFISVLVNMFYCFLFPVIRYTSPNYIRFSCLKICLMGGKWLHLCARGCISVLCSRSTRGKWMTDRLLVIKRAWLFDTDLRAQVMCIDLGLSHEMGSKKKIPGKQHSSKSVLTSLPYPYKKKRENL